MRRLVLGVMAVLWMAGGAAAQQAGVLRLREHFGVDHPMQIVEFPRVGEARIKAGLVKESAGQWTPFQVLSGGRVALMTDLPAGAARAWSFSEAKAEGIDGLAHAVRVTTEGKLLRIENGMTGVLIPAEAGERLLSPIQGFRYRDGTWTATGPNDLRSADLKGPVLRWVERGPLKVVVELRYAGDAGKSYSSRVEVQAGQPSVLVEEDGDVNVEYALDLRRGLEPDEGRYRYLTDKNPEAIVKLELGTARRYGRMASWDPWAGQQNRGWSWQLYDSRSGPAANVFGMFAGCASRIIEGNRGGAEVFTGADGAAGVVFRLSGDGRRVRIPWGLFAGVKGADWTEQTTSAERRGGGWDFARVQGVNRQMNLHAGINLTKLITYGLEDYPDPARGYGTMFLSREALAAQVERVRTDEAYFKKVSAECASDRPMFDVWRDRSGRKAGELADKLIADYGRWTSSPRYVLDQLVNGYGINDMDTHYWMGGLGMIRRLLWLDQALARPDGLSDEQQTRLKAMAALFGGILWDDDFVPMHPEAAVNMGTPNMPVQYTGMRHAYALFLCDHPNMKVRAARVREEIAEQVGAQVNDHGSHMSCTHYIGAAMWPTLNTLLQLQASGLGDGFRDDARMARFAEFYMQLATPPDPRVGGKRVIVPTGDSEPDDPFVLAGMLATGFATSNPDLSARLMGLWRQSGSRHDNFYGCTVVKVDERLPAADPTLGSATFPGYLSVLRSSWGTPHESAVWLIAGDYYRDHRHDDRGEVIVYALGAPLSLDFASMYSPRAASATVKSVVMPASAKWKAVPAEYDDRSGNWSSSTLGELRADPHVGGRATATMKGFGGEWTRAVALGMATPQQPVIAIQDRVTGGRDFVASLNLFCTDTLQTPDGPRKPGESFALKAGVNRIACIGQPLPAHATGGIDFDLYIVSAGPQQGFLSEWSHKNHIATRQVLLRVAGRNRFRMFAVPYPKGARPAAIDVREEGATVVVTVDGKSVRFDAEGKLEDAQ